MVHGMLWVCCDDGGMILLALAVRGEKESTINDEHT